MRTDTFEVISKQGLLYVCDVSSPLYYILVHFSKNATFTSRNELTINIIFLFIRGHINDYNSDFDIRYLISKTCLIKNETNRMMSS